MAKVYFDFSASTNGDGTPNNPKNTIASYVFTAGDEFYFKRGTTTNTGFTIVQGSSGKPTIYGTWYYPDGSDEPNQPRPIFNINSSLSTYSGKKDNFIMTGLNFQATFTPASDMSVVFMGSNSRISDCYITSNLGCVASWGKSNVTIENCFLSGVSEVTTYSNNVIIVSDTKAMDNIVVRSNTVVFGNGGGSQSNAIRAECADNTLDLTNLVVEWNNVYPAGNLDYTTNLNAIGIRLQRCPGAAVRFNSVRGMLSGIFLVGGGNPISVWIEGNNCSYNMNFGIQLTTDTKGCLIEYNNCSHNGTSNISANCYGRGIELSSGAGQGRCSYHIVRFNECNNNVNYGGPGDNGSEGVGIGLDDGTLGCLVYGNHCAFNEGNGIQVFGGGNTATWTETGGNYIVGNHFESNCTASYEGRQSGSVTESVFIAHVALAYSYGRNTHVANNTMNNGKLGVSISSTCTNCYVSNNIFYAVANGVQFGGTPGNCQNNLFWQGSLSSQNKYVTMTAGSTLISFTPIAYAGTNDIVQEPMLDFLFRPVNGSPCIGAGVSIGQFNDTEGRPFKNPPSIGMVEYYPQPNPLLHL